MDPTTRRLITKYSVITAVTSFITQPVPGADELIVVPIHYYFSASLLRHRRQPLLTAPWLQLSKIIWGGAGARLFANFTLGLIPVAGLFSNAATAVILTEVLGGYLNETLDNPGQPVPISIQTLKRALRQSWFERAQTS